MKIKSVKSINPCISVIQTGYDIVTKGYGGELKVETLSSEAAVQAGKEGRGTTFIILLPL
jgi:hypothetical protein